MPTPPVPQHCPTAAELDDLELLASGALGELTAFNQPDSAVTLTLPEPVAAQARAVGAVELVDPEGLNDWQAEFVVDLAQAREAGKVALVLGGIGAVVEG